MPGHIVVLKRRKDKTMDIIETMPCISETPDPVTLEKSWPFNSFSDYHNYAYAITREADLEPSWWVSMTQVKNGRVYWTARRRVNPGEITWNDPA